MKDSRAQPTTNAPPRNMDALGQIADSVAHDFTNVFAVILAYANFIEQASAEGDSRREDAGQILAAAGLGTTLIRQLLAVSGHATEKKVVELNDSLDQTHGLLVRALAARCELDVVLSQAPILVRIDPVRFDQIVMGLVLNACGDAPPGEKVRVSLERIVDGSGARTPIARLTVTGGRAGSSPDAQRLLFQPTPDDVTALGLANCLRWVEEAAGTLGVQTEEGQGTTLTVDLPIYEEPSQSAELDLGQLGHGERVLIAESDPGLRYAAVRAFERAGYQVSQAANCDEARAKVVELGVQLDALVIDATVRGTGDRDVLTFVSPRIVRVLTRVFASDQAVPGVHTLYKPLLPTDLVYAVSQALLELQPSTPVASRASKVVLIVEDDDALRAALERILNYANYPTQVAATLAAARGLLESEPEPGFLLCDLSLPDGSGVELLEWIGKTRPSLARRALILSGGAVEDADGAFARSGAFPLLSKPIDAAALLRILDDSGRR